jgi:multimeric flavodoxin WrbA
MARNFVRGAQSFGCGAEVLRLREYSVLPCSACRACSEHPDAACPLGERDDAEFLFRRFAESPLICIAAPIFFYHLPAQLKALIDRSQRYWARRPPRGENPGQRAAPRPGFVALVAARTRGDKLFEGSMLTLRYFLDVFDIRITEDCRLTGYDRPGELAGDDAACMRLFEMGAKAAALVR